MVIIIEIFRDDHLVEREIGEITRTLVKQGRHPKKAYSIASKKAKRVQCTQTINIDPKYDKDINPVKIAKDICGRKRFKVTTTKTQ